MQRHGFALVIGVLAVVACCVWAPWVQVNSSVSTDVAFLGFAPVWTANFRNFPGARIDVLALATHVSLSVILASLLGLGRALRRAREVAYPGVDSSGPTR